MLILERLRVESGKTQEKLADEVGVDIDIYRGIERDPETASPKVLLKLCKFWSIDMAQLFEPEIESLRQPIINPYAATFTRNRLIQSYLSDFESVNEDSHNLIKSTIQSISLSSQKPNLGVMGRSDAGKSHFINTLLGDTTLPAQLQPTTSAVTILRHLSDKPSWLNTGQNVLIFREQVNIIELDDEEFCTDKKRLYASGDIKLLSSEIVHDHFNENTSSAYSCVVYIEADILNVCNIIDAPGFANTDTDKGNHSDTSKALSMLKMVDVLIYMSPVTGCMDHTDMASLRAVFKTLSIPEEVNSSLPVLSNLFFVTSQAAPHISDLELEVLINKASNRIYKQFYTGDDSGVLEVRGSRLNKVIDQKILKSRWYSFWSSSPNRSTHLIDSICQYLQVSMPDTIKRLSIKSIDEIRKNGSETLKNYVTLAQNQLIKYELLIDESKRALKPAVIASKIKQIDQTKIDLLKMIEEARSDTYEKLQNTIEDVLNPKSMESLIKENYKDREEAKKYAAGLILERAQSKVEKTFLDNIKHVETEISEKLDSCSVAMNKVDGQETVSIPFDVKGVFSGVVTGALFTVSLGVYASSLGALGGYAVAAQGVGVLSSLGLGFAWSGGTSGLMSGIAALGGPVTITLALAVGLAFVVKKLFGESWEKRLADEILKKFEKLNVKGKIFENIGNEFSLLESTVNKGVENLNEGYNLYINSLQNQVDNPIVSRAKLVERVEELRDDLTFFIEAPWAHV